MWLQTPYSFYYVERKKKLQQSGHLQRQCCVSGSCQTGVLGCRINGRSIGGTCTGAGYPGKNNASQRLGRESLQFHVRCKRNYFFKSKVWVKCNYWIHVNMSPHNIIKLGFVFFRYWNYFYSQSNNSSICVSKTSFLCQVLCFVNSIQKWLLGSALELKFSKSKFISCYTRRSQDNTSSALTYTSKTSWYTLPFQREGVGIQRI